MTLIFVFLLWISPVFSQKDNSVYSVKSGESLSLICIEYYGFYHSELGSVIQKSNPTIKNINKLYVGQPLRLPPPESLTQSTLSLKKVAASEGIVTFVEGKVTHWKKGKKSGLPLNVNTTIGPGDVIETGDEGRAELILNQESVVRLKEKTRLRIEKLKDPAESKSKTELFFSLGTVWSKIKSLSDQIQRFELSMPNAIAGVHGTVYQTTVNTDSSADVKVFDGEVQVRNQSPASPAGSKSKEEISGPTEIAGPSEVSMEEWTEIVRSMQRIHINRQGQPGQPENFEGNQDDHWEQWNRERDNRLQSILSRD